MLNPRTAVAVGLGALLAVVLRMRGSVPAPPAPGGWRDLDEAMLRPGSAEEAGDLK